MDSLLQLWHVKFHACIESEHLVLSQGLVVSGCYHRQIHDYPTWNEIFFVHVVFICFVPETGTRFVIMDGLVTMHQTTSDHEIMLRVLQVISRLPLDEMRCIYPWLVVAFLATVFPFDISIFYPFSDDRSNLPSIPPLLASINPIPPSLLHPIPSHQFILLIRENRAWWNCKSGKSTNIEKKNLKRRYIFSSSLYHDRVIPQFGRKCCYSF